VVFVRHPGDDIAWGFGKSRDFCDVLSLNHGVRGDEAPHSKYGSRGFDVWDVPCPTDKCTVGMRVRLGCHVVVDVSGVLV